VVNVIPQRSSKYVAVLAVAAGLILAAGWLLRPRDIPQSPPPVPSDSELKELARRTQRRSLESTTAYFAELAASVRPSLGYLPSLGMSAVAWDDSRVITGPIPVADRAVALSLRTASGERNVDATSSRRLPVSVVDLHVTAPARVARRAASPPQSGDWVIAVWQTDEASAYAPGNARHIARTTCGIGPANEFTTSILLTPAMIGGGIFNMDGDLLAVILSCDNHVAAIDLASIDDLLARVTAVEERLLARYGVLFTSFSSDERRYFSDVDGLLVREVWIGTRGDAAGFQPGDVVVAVNDRAVAGIDDLRTLTAASDAAVVVKVRRGSKTQTLTLDQSIAAPAESDVAGADVGLMIESPAVAFRIDRVPPHSRAAHAGVTPGDILRRINNVETRTRAQADRALKVAATKPMLLEIERDQRRLAIIVPEGTAR
jgi:S1-C subfamily serine protease